jgi:Domain of unknown function (DUF4386)
MTRTTNARLAGFTYLFYIAVAFPSMVLFDRATSGNGTAAKLASIARHASDVRVAVVLSLLGCFSALVLAVTLYGITRDEDHELAMLGLTFRVGEGVVGAAGITKVLGLLSLASAGAGAASAEVAAANALGAFLLMPGSLISATFFAVGSTLFSYLLLRGRMVPVPLAWLGVVASVLLTVLLPAQLAGFLKGPLTFYIWMPMLVFEVVLALWLLIKGVAVQTTR